MNVYNNQQDNIYEGTEPYLFISYSHRDQNKMNEVKRLLEDNNVRFWYDNGLHSGDDWNMVIAKHLQTASVCLLLLSPNSAVSEYVKNELNFAMNHRIPIHILSLEEFELPLDIEMMIGRIQVIKMKGMYSKQLFKSLPTELYYHNSMSFPKKEYKHPLFEMEKELNDRQGTKTFLGKHERLGYKCSIQLDSIKSDDKNDAQVLASIAAKISHILFPKIYDIVIDEQQALTYQEYREEQFLDEYLKTHELTEEQILEWIRTVVDGLDYLFSRNLGIRDFARGSMVVLNNKQIGMSRLQNLYYGIVELKPETKAYYFEIEVQEIAVLLVQLCTGNIPVLPLRIVENNRFSKAFLKKINIVVQKCSKENGRLQYVNFKQILNDLSVSKISFADTVFLKKRAKKLAEYDQARNRRYQQFTSNDGIQIPANNSNNNLEEEYGFDETVVLNDNSLQNNFGSSIIKIMICSTGQILEFSKREIIIGKGRECDMVWTQPAISRRHLCIMKNEDETYTITDLHSTNGTFIILSDGTTKEITAPNGEKVEKETLIKIADTEIKII